MKLFLTCLHRKMQIALPLLQATLLLLSSDITEQPFFSITISTKSALSIGMCFKAFLLGAACAKNASSSGNAIATSFKAFSPDLILIQLLINNVPKIAMDVRW